MIVHDLEIDGFGVWTGLSLGPFAEGLNVVHGPNEAGKTTLLEFVRSMLYGLSGYRRARYLPPLRGGQAGGSLSIANRSGQCRIARHDRSLDGQPPSESFALTTATGTTQDASQLTRLLHDVDETTFTNVFAVGLREMQELGTLGDTAAARLLYDLSTGVDRVSLGNVLRELAVARRRLLAPEPEACQIRQLTVQRDRLRREVEELGGLSRDYVALARERDDLEGEVARLTQEQRDLERQLRLVETATLLRGNWSERDSLDRELAACGDPRELPEQALKRLDEANRRIRRAADKASACVRGRRELKSAAAALGVNAAIWRQAPRIAALSDQMEWITALERQATECDKEIADLEAQLAAERKKLGVDLGPATSGEPKVSTRTLAALRPIARELHESARRYKAAQQETRTSQQAAASLAAEAEVVLGELPEKDLMSAVENAGNLVTQLRRRVQLEQRLEQLVRQDRELEERSHDLIDRQLLPLWVLAALGGLFVFGVVLILAAWFLPVSVTGSWGWALAVLGLGGTIAAGVTKHNLEKSAERQLESCEKQLSMLRHSIQQAKREREELDTQLPSGGGALAIRLEQAEKRLAELEELLPLESRQKLARQDGKSAALKAQEAKRELTEVRRRWSAALKSAGCPADLSPKQVSLFARGSQQVRDVERRLERRRQERKQVERSWLGLRDRISQLAAEVGLDPKNSGAIEQVRRLRQALGEQETLVAQRNALAARAKKLRRKQAGYVKHLGQAQRRRLALLRSAGVSDERDLRRLVEQAGRWRGLHDRRQALDGEIAAALGTHSTEEEVRAVLAASPHVTLETRWDELAARLATCESAVRSRHERRGQLAERLAALAADRRPLEKQWELAQVEARLAEATERWQVLAVTGQLVESVRHDYERDRQPETLREASQYLEQLTAGQYRRIWTPLSEDVLLVDNREGQSLPVEALSRGTREQLFLSLRLALAAAYARRGAALPLILDDVFVNFDTQRTRAAVSLMIDFAAAGHQVFVFTCHDHILKMFKARKVPVLSLPGSEREPEAIVHEDVPPEPVVVQRPVKKPRPRPAAEVTLVAEEGIGNPFRVDEVREAHAKVPKQTPDPFDVPPTPSEDEAPFEGPADDGFGMQWIGKDEEVESLFRPDDEPNRRILAPKKASDSFFLGYGAEEFEGEFAERPGPSHWRDRFGYRHHDDEFNELYFRPGADDAEPHIWLADPDDAEAA